MSIISLWVSKRPINQGGATVVRGVGGGSVTSPLRSAPYQPQGFSRICICLYPALSQRMRAGPSLCVDEQLRR